MDTQAAFNAQFEKNLTKLSKIKDYKAFQAFYSEIETELHEYKVSPFMLKMPYSVEVKNTMEQTRQSEIANFGIRLEHINQVVGRNLAIAYAEQAKAQVAAADEQVDALYQAALQKIDDAFDAIAEMTTLQENLSTLTDAFSRIKILYRGVETGQEYVPTLPFITARNWEYAKRDSVYSGKPYLVAADLIFQRALATKTPSTPLQETDMTPKYAPFNPADYGREE